MNCGDCVSEQKPLGISSSSTAKDKEVQKYGQQMEVTGGLIVSYD
jgi:hypothetical protein